MIIERKDVQIHVTQIFSIFYGSFLIIIRGQYNQRRISKGLEIYNSVQSPALISPCWCNLYPVEHPLLVSFCFLSAKRIIAVKCLEWRIESVTACLIRAAALSFLLIIWQMRSEGFESEERPRFLLFRELICLSFSFQGCNLYE